MRPCPPRLVILVGLNRPFRIGDSLHSRPPPGSQGLLPLKWTRCPRMTLLAAADRAVSFWPARAGTFVAAPLVCARPSVAVSQVAPLARACLLLAASRVRVWSHLAAVFPAHALPCHMPRAPTLRFLRQLLSQPCLQARCWRFPWPGLVWHARPAVLPLVHAH